MGGKEKERSEYEQEGPMKPEYLFVHWKPVPCESVRALFALVIQMCTDRNYLQDTESHN